MGVNETVCTMGVVMGEVHSPGSHMRENNEG